MSLSFRLFSPVEWLKIYKFSLYPKKKYSELLNIPNPVGS